MKILKRYWLIVTLSAVAGAAIAVFQLKGSDNPQYFTAKVGRGDISQVVEATGTISAVNTIQVGSQVSVQENNKPSLRRAAKAGDPISENDQPTLKRRENYSE